MKNFRIRLRNVAAIAACLAATMMTISLCMLTACHDDDERLLEIAINARVSGLDPDNPERKCLLAKWDNYTEWTPFWNTIENFNYVDDYEYKLLVRETKVKNPPMDASLYRYVLVEVMTMTPKEVIDQVLIL